MISCISSRSVSLMPDLVFFGTASGVAAFIPLLCNEGSGEGRTALPRPGLPLQRGGVFPDLPPGFTDIHLFTDSPIHQSLPPDSRALQNVVDQVLLDLALQIGVAAGRSSSTRFCRSVSFPFSSGLSPKERMSSRIFASTSWTRRRSS